MPDGRFAQPTAIDIDCRITVDEDVVLDLEVPSTAEKHRPVKLPQHITVDVCAADAVIHIDSHRAHTHSAGMVNEVVAYDVSAECVVPARIDSTNIAGLKTNVMDFVEFDKVVIAPKKDCAMRMVMDQVVGNAETHARHQNRGHIASGPSGYVVNVVVVGEVACWS